MGLVKIPLEAIGISPYSIEYIVGLVNIPIGEGLIGRRVGLVRIPLGAHRIAQNSFLSRWELSEFLKEGAGLVRIPKGGGRIGQNS